MWRMYLGPAVSPLTRARNGREKKKKEKFPDKRYRDTSGLKVMGRKGLEVSTQVSPLTAIYESDLRKVLDDISLRIDLRYRLGTSFLTYTGGFYPRPCADWTWRYHQD